MLTKSIISLFSGFCLLTTALASPSDDANAPEKDLITRQSDDNDDNTWTVSDVFIGCGVNWCSYQFHIRSDESDDLPGFTADCVSRKRVGNRGGIRFRDERTFDCRVTDQITSQDLQVSSVQTQVFLDPRRPRARNNRIKVLLTFVDKSDPKNPDFYTWGASITRSYRYFSQGVKDGFKLKPKQYPIS